MDRLTRHPLLKDLSLETVVDYTVDFIRIVGVPQVFLEKVKEVDIEKYRGVLPCDFYSIIQVRSTSDEPIGHRHTYRYSTDSFHMNPNEHRNYNSDLTYKIQGNCIFVSPMENGKIEIAYKALPVDDEGLPLIVDNGTFAKALELYIKLQQFTILFDTGKLHNSILQNTQQEYDWAVGQATNDLVLPSIDQMQSISNMWNKLLDTSLEHEHGFKYLGSKEHFRIQ